MIRCNVINLRVSPKYLLIFLTSKLCCDVYYNYSHLNRNIRSLEI